MDKKDKSLVNILNTIQNKIVIYEENIKKDQSSLDNLQQLFSKDITTLTTRDLKEQPLSKLKRIIEAIKMTMNDFSNVDFTEIEGLAKLLGCIKDFINVHKDRIAKNNADLGKCEKFVELLTNKKSKIEFDDDFAKDHESFIKTLGLLTEDKLYAKRVIAQKIVSSAKADPELTQSVVYLHGYQANNPELRNIILSTIDKNGRKIELHNFKTFADEIAEANDVSSELVQNIIVSILKDQEYKKYLTTSESKHLDTIKLLDHYKVDDKKVVIAEANRIIQREINELRKVTFNSLEDIVVSDADSKEEFDYRKARKKLMLAYILKETLDEFDNNTDREKDDDFKRTIAGFCEEYMNTEHIEYVDRTR